MQTRLLACGVGLLLGFCLTPTINASLGLPPVMAFAGLGIAGLALGYAVSLIIDAFSASHGGDHGSSAE